MAAHDSLRRTLDFLSHDLPHAMRGLLRSPGLTATVLITLGLGIGANAAVFTVFDHVFFRPPPGIADPGSLRRLYAHRISAAAPEYGAAGSLMPVVSTADVRALALAAKGIARVEADYLDLGEQFPEGARARLTFVTSGYFDLLGIRIQRGRAFSPDESRLPGPVPPAAVISDALWRTRFGADPEILGKIIEVGETRYSIVGVAAPEFRGMELHTVDLWVPLGNVANGNIVSLRAIARIEPGGDVRLLEERLSLQYRETNTGDHRVGEGSRIIVAPLHPARGPAQRINGMPQRSIALLSRLPLVGVIVFLIAIANVASLLLMRAFRRQREIALRIALGISPARLAMQHVTEGLILALAAGGVALVFASMTGGLLRAQLGPGVRWPENVVDFRVVFVTIAIAAGSGVLASFAPTFISLRRDIAATLKPMSAALGRTGSRLRSTLLITQAALCMALLASAGVFLQSLRRAGEADRGFDPHRTVLVSLPAAYASSESDLSRIRDAIRSLPGIEAVGRSHSGIYSLGLRGKVGLSLNDTVGENPRGPWLHFVDRDWGRAVGVRLISGRMLDSSHVFGSYAVVNEALSRALFRGKNPAGACVRVREPNGTCREVVGVIRDIRGSLGSESQQSIYVPMEQAWSRPPVALIPNALVVRTQSVTAASDVERIRALILPMSPDASRTTVRRVSEMLDAELRPWRLASVLFLSLGVLGLMAAAAGIYGLVSYDVSQRVRELGVRIALGASSASILRLVVGAGLKVVAVGAGIGVVAALMTGQAMASLLYATAPYDPLVLLGTAVVLVAVTAIASLVPAWKATRVSPVEALASE